jgi:hypothetical protein
MLTCTQYRHVPATSDGEPGGPYTTDTVTQWYKGQRQLV